MIEKESVKVQGGLENETLKTLGPEKETVKVVEFATDVGADPAFARTSASDDVVAGSDGTRAN